MGYSITSNTQLDLDKGGANWAWVSDAKDSSKNNVRMVVEFTDHDVFNQGGHFPILLFPTGPGTYGETNPHPVHPGAQRPVSSGNPLWVRGLGIALGSSGFAWEVWDGTDNYAKAGPSFTLSTGRRYRVTLEYNKNTEVLSAKLEKQLYGYWYLVDSDTLSGFSIPSAQATSSEAYWYAAIAAYGSPNSVPNGGNNDVDFYRWNGSSYAFSNTGTADPNYTSGQLNDTVSNNGYFTIHSAYVEQF